MVGATCKVLNRLGATIATATISSVSNQYNGTTRTIRLRQKSTGLTWRPFVVTTMMKPLMTKKRSTPEVPNCDGTHVAIPGI